MVKILLKCGLQFPFINKAVQILQSILPETHLTPEEELLFVLRAYGKAITGQNIQIEKIIQKEDYSFDAFLDRGNTMAMKDQFSRKIVAITNFNKWLKEHEFSIQVKPNHEYM
ncbi:MAG: hypothetical protein HWN66_21475 [Candidatus Helarchaeota archaeon]|nr:hypothetical protein [Candidatus Helarchaeota archaeon]